MVNYPPLLQHQVYPHLSRQVGHSIGREYSQCVGTNVTAKDMVKKCLRQLSVSDLPNGTQVLPSEPRRLLPRGFVDP